MKHKGQNLVETLIILSVIVIGAIVVLTLLGNNVGNMYSLAADKVVNFNPFGEHTPITTEPPAGGSLGGTPDNPVKQCNSGTCNIDYGEFILTGIPENFGELVKTTGTSGGTDQLVSLIEQIAEQLQKNGDMDGYKEYKNLANLGHLMSAIQAKTENTVNSCVSNNTGIDIYSCYNSTIVNPANIDLLPELVDILPDYNGAQDLTSLNYFTNVGFERNQKILNPGLTPTWSPAGMFVDVFDKIMANDKYSTQMRGVTQELYLNIGDIATDQNENFRTALIFGSYVTEESYPSDYVYEDPGVRYDPLTGIDTTYNNSWSLDSYNTILHPPTSGTANLNSALICSAGWKKDTGSNCH